VEKAFVKLASLIPVLTLAACAADVGGAPPARPGIVIWQMVPQDQVAAACGHPNERRIGGCLKNNGVIVTRPPTPGDYSLIDILNREVANAERLWSDPWTP
jgi:hypothetical protein